MSLAENHRKIGTKPSYVKMLKNPGKFTPRRNPNYTPERRRRTPERTEMETQEERKAREVKRKENRVQSLEHEFMQLVRIRAEGENCKKKEERDLEVKREKVEDVKRRLNEAIARLREVTAEAAVVEKEMKVQKGVVEGCGITWDKIMREVEKNKRESADAREQLRALQKPKPKPAPIVPLPMATPTVKEEESRGANPKVPQSFPAADIRERKKEKGEKQKPVNTTLEEVVASWDKNTTPDQDPSLALSPPILPPLPQRPRPQRELEEQREEEEQVETPVKPDVPHHVPWVGLRPGLEHPQVCPSIFQEIRVQSLICGTHQGPSLLENDEDHEV